MRTISGQKRKKSYVIVWVRERKHPRHLCVWVVWSDWLWAGRKRPVSIAIVIPAACFGRRLLSLFLLSFLQAVVYTITVLR